MEMTLSNEEVEVLREQLEQDLKTLEIEAIRADNRDFHRMLQHKADVAEGILKKLTGVAI